VKLLFENWRRYLEEVMQFSVSDYRDPQHDINILQSKIGMAQRLKKPLSFNNGKYVVTYEHPLWIVVEDGERNKFKDIFAVKEYLQNKVNIKSAEMSADPDSDSDDAAELRNMEL